MIKRSASHSSWVLPLAAALALACGTALDSQAQGGPSRLVVFSDVVKLAQAHQADDVILSYVRGTGAAFNLTADEIIYLSNSGVSQTVIAALQAKGPAAPPPLAAPVPPEPVSPVPVGSPAGPGPGGPPPAGEAAPEVTFDYFHGKLAGDGAWLDLPEYGHVWRPNAAVVDSEWRPYSQRGHWVYTESGWFWQSEDPWGEIVFHYGRWHRSHAFGWVWVPGYDYGPSWVSWRHSEGYLGWAPLPPEAVFTVGVGLSFRGRVGVDLDFGLAEAHYNFVAYDHFWETDYHRHYVPRERVIVLYRGSHLANSYRVENHHFINEGYGRERIALVTHREVVVVRPVIRDPIIVRHVERTVVVVKVGEKPAGHSEAAHPAGAANHAGAPAATPAAAHPAAPAATPAATHPATASTTPVATPPAAHPAPAPATPAPVTSPTRPATTYGSGGGSTSGSSTPPLRPTAPSSGGSKTNRPAGKH